LACSLHGRADRREGSDGCTKRHRVLPSAADRPGVVESRFRGKDCPVIDDVDASVLGLVRTAIPQHDAAVRFDAPTADWVAALKGPCIDLFLHDIVEDVGGRGADWVDIKDGDGRVIARQPPLRRYRLSYLVSAWASSPEVEHRLLGRLLRALVEADHLAAGVLVGSLLEEARYVNVALAEPSPSRLRPHDLWSALGAPPRTSFELVVTAPLRPAPVSETAPPVETLDLEVSREPGPRPPAVVATGKSGDPTGRLGLPGEKRWTSFRIREKGAATEAAKPPG
jgi:hypothetical protein